MKRYSSLFLFAALAVCAHASPLVTPAPTNLYIIGWSNTIDTLAMGFHLSSAQNNVLIEAAVDSVQPQPNTVFYLMNKIGAGTTVANELGALSIALPSTGTLPFVTLFSGLNLAAGDYYVVAGLPAWTQTTQSRLGYSSTAPTVAAGVTYLGNFATAAVNAPYLPSSNFISVTENLTIRVSTADAVSATPEPSTGLLLGCALTVTAVLRRRRR